MLVVGTGCNQILGHLPKTYMFMNAQPCLNDRFLAVGDSLPFHAHVSVSNKTGGMSGPFDNTLLYESVGSPGSFRWSVTSPQLESPSRRFGAGGADITRNGVLIGRETGLVVVHVRSAGKHEEVGMRIVPRITRFTMSTRDTSLRTGRFAWHAFSELLPVVSEVERDPDGTTRPDPRALALVAERPGVQPIEVCVGGGRRDTVMLRVSGSPRPPPNRDVPPRIRLTPADTIVYTGVRFGARLRILNANTHNGPWRWRVTTGDGEAAEGHRDFATSSAFGFEVSAIADHAYRTAGRYQVQVTVSDAQGRSAQLRTTWAARDGEYQLEALPGNPHKVVRLSDGDPDLPIAILNPGVLELHPSRIGFSSSFEQRYGRPALLFGSTAFEQEIDGRRVQYRDVNGDGREDVVLYLDRAALLGNGDLHPGHNRLAMTGSIQRGRRRDEPPLYTPVRGVVEFEVVP